MSVVLDPIRMEDLERLFDNGADDAFCHLFNIFSQVSFCGTANNVRDGIHTGKEYKTGMRACPDCGRPICPDCIYIADHREAT